MGPMLRFLFAGALGLLVLLPVLSSSAINSLVAGSGNDTVLTRAGLPADFGDTVIARLQGVRSEIRGQQCARGAQRYCLLGHCWTLAVPAHCAETAGARLGRLSVDR